MHMVHVTPFGIRPNPTPRVYDKPPLLPGIWLEGINSDFGRAVSTAVGIDTHELPYLMVVDLPEYTRGMLERLRLEGLSKRQLDALASPPPAEWRDLYSEHPAELDVFGDDILKLVFLAAVLSGSDSFVFHGPVLVEKKTEVEKKGLLEVHSWSVGGRRWNRPRRRNRVALREQLTEGPNTRGLDLTLVNHGCLALEPFFRPVYWHAGRLAVALGAMWASMTANDPAQSYLTLMTVFEAILSTEKTEISHQIAERTAFLLEKEEEKRFQVYRRMKQLYGIRSRVVHGDVENRPGHITTDRLRLDAKFTVVPENDAADAFELCVRLLNQVLSDRKLVALLQEKKSKEALNEYYVRLGFRP